MMTALQLLILIHSINVLVNVRSSPFGCFELFLFSVKLFVENFIMDSEGRQHESRIDAI